MEWLLASLDTLPGAWLGCDVQSEGLYRRESMGCSAPALGFQLDGSELRVLALSQTGATLLEHIRPLAAFEVIEGGLAVTFPAADAHPHPVIGLLRSFLALFSPPCAELGLYGAFSFDFYRLARAEALPDDGRRRMMLYFPDRILVTNEKSTRWVDFRFPDLNPALEIPFGCPHPVRVESETDDLPPGGHAKQVREGLKLLASGDLFSLVLSQTFRRRFNVRTSAAFAALRSLNPYPAMFFLNLGGGERLFGASPDLQVRADHDWVESAPVCGTLRRGVDPIEDADQVCALLVSDKEDASLAACADSDRNDKAKVCVPGSIELVTHRRVHLFSTIMHTIDHVRGRRRPGVDALDILLAHSTPATVTGLPKPAAIRAIEEIETTWRGWYAGAVARLSTDGSAEVFTVLRAARIVGTLAEVRTGGNLLVDSDPEKEEEETRLKAETLFRVLSGVSPRAPESALNFERRYRVVLLGPDDPMLACLKECLQRIGCDVADSIEGDGGATLVLSDTSPEALQVRMGSPSPVLALGTAGLALLKAQGGALKTLPEPRYARRISAQPQAGGFAAHLGPLELGLYARQAIETKGLPSNWKASLICREGWVIAAERLDLPQIVVLCRPDSVQSLKAEAGRRLLRTALDRLAGRLSEL